MARLPIVETQTATGSNKDIFAFLQKNLGMVPNMARVMANSPAVLQGYAQFSGALGAGKLSGKIREQIALLAGEVNSCTYCLSAHSALGKMAGLNGDDINAARHGRANDSRTQAALTFAKKLLESRGAASEADVRAVRDAGLSDAEIAEVIGAVALNVFTNYFNHALDVDVDFPRVEAHRHAGVR